MSGCSVNTVKVSKHLIHRETQAAFIQKLCLQTTHQVSGDVVMFQLCSHLLMVRSQQIQSKFSAYVAHVSLFKKICFYLRYC